MNIHKHILIAYYGLPMFWPNNAIAYHAGNLSTVWGALGSYRLRKCSSWAWMVILGTAFPLTRPAAAQTAGMPGELAAIRTPVTLLLVHMTSLNDLTCRSIHAVPPVQVGVTWNGGRRKACSGRMLCRCVAIWYPGEQMARWISSAFVHMCRFAHMEGK